MKEKIYELLKQNRNDVDSLDENGNYEPNLWWLAEDLEKLYNLHFVSNNEVAVCRYWGSCYRPEKMKYGKLCINKCTQFRQTDC